MKQDSNFRERKSPLHSTEVRSWANSCRESLWLSGSGSGIRAGNPCGYDYSVGSVAWNADGRRVGINHWGGIIDWRKSEAFSCDAWTGSVLTRHPRNGARRVLWSLDGSSLLIGGTRHVGDFTLFGPEDGYAGTLLMYAATYSPDGTYFLAAGTKDIFFQKQGRLRTKLYGGSGIFSPLSVEHHGCCSMQYINPAVFLTRLLHFYLQPHVCV